MNADFFNFVQRILDYMAEPGGLQYA